MADSDALFFYGTIFIAAILAIIYFIKQLGLI